MNKKTLNWMIGYILTVILFAGIYYLIWLNKPDNYIINTDLNNNPFEKTYKFLWTKEKVLPNEYKSLNKVNSEFNELYDELNNLNKVNDILEDEKKLLEIEIDNIHDKKELEVTKNFEKYKEDSLNKLYEKEKEIRNEISKLKNKISISNSHQDIIESGKILSSKYNLLIEHIDVISQLEQKVYSKYIDEYSFFISVETKNKLNELANNTYLKNERIRDITKRISKKREELIDLYEKYRKITIDKLNYIDFFYFSIGISTTTTFGDIIGNSKITRGLISLQLLICIILLTGLVDSILRKKEN